MIFGTVTIQVIKDGFTTRVQQDFKVALASTTLFKKKSLKIVILISVFYLCTSQPKENEQIQ